MASNPSGTLDVLVMYRPQPGQEDAAEALIQKNWPTLHRLGMATAKTAQVWRALDANGGTTFFEVFTWTDATALDRAGENAEVTAIWDAMSPIMAGMDILRAAPVPVT
ncbi:MAG: hypothetical protein U1F43_02390 [Myxococcota bacterium]